MPPPNCWRDEQPVRLCSVTRAVTVLGKCRRLPLLAIFWACDGKERLKRNNHGEASATVALLQTVMTDKLGLWRFLTHRHRTLDIPQPSYSRTRPSRAHPITSQRNRLLPQSSLDRSNANNANVI